jgi:hypothetical protein
MRVKSLAFLNFMRLRSLVRIGVVIAVVAAQLSSALASPRRVITVPTTVVRSVHLEALSTPARVAFDFSATHIAFSWRGPQGAALRYRTVASAGDVAAWKRVAEVHGSLASEKLHRHYSAVIATDEVVGVDWAASGKRVTDVVLDYLNTLDGPRREVTLPSVAEAAANEPQIITRAEWGADEALKHKSGGCTRRFFPLQQIFVHHTAGENFDAHPKATMRAIYWYHVVRQGWCDIGYNFVIAPDGTLYEGRWARHYRPWEKHDAENGVASVVAGAHVADYNSGSMGISLMGNYSQVELPPAARQTLVQLLAWETDRHNLIPQGQHVYRNPEGGPSRSLHYIAGHRDAGSTACPGTNVYRDLPDIRREVATLKGSGKADSIVELQPVTRHVDYDEPARFEGRLTNEALKPRGTRPVSTYFRVAGRRWRQGPAIATSADGTFSFEVPAERNVQAIAAFDGDATYWGDQSDVARVLIDPLVTIEAEDGTPDTAGVSHHPSGTEYVVLSGSVTPAHVRQGVSVMIERFDGSDYQPVGTERAPLDDSSAYSLDFPVPDEGGTFRATTLFLRDQDHGSARSDPVVFVVDP